MEHSRRNLFVKFCSNTHAFTHTAQQAIAESGGVVVITDPFTSSTARDYRVGLRHGRTSCCHVIGTGVAGFYDGRQENPAIILSCEN